jgi:hypothetical protein
MPYITSSIANQLICIAKDYIGTQFYSFVAKDANGCGRKNDWTTLLCFYELYRIAGHRVEDLINDPYYQNIMANLFSQVALTSNYSLATCNSNVIVANGGCGCEGGSTTTGSVSGSTDSILPFHMNPGDSFYTNLPVLGNAIPLIVLREGIGMRMSSTAVDGYVIDSQTGRFTPNSPISPQGEDFVILYKKTNTSGNPVPPTALPSDIEFRIGVTAGAPAAGTTTYVNASMANRLIRLDRSGLEQTLIGYSTGEGFTTPDGSGLINVSPPWIDQEFVKIKFYK